MLRTMNSFRRQLADSGAAIRSVFQNPNLRRLELALGGTELAGWGYSIAVSVFDRMESPNLALSIENVDSTLDRL